MTLTLLWIRSGILGTKKGQRKVKMYSSLKRHFRIQCIICLSVGRDHGRRANASSLLRSARRAPWVPRGKHTSCSQCPRTPAHDLGYPLFPGWFGINLIVPIFLFLFPHWHSYFPHILTNFQTVTRKGWLTSGMMCLGERATWRAEHPTSF